MHALTALALSTRLGRGHRRVRPVARLWLALGLVACSAEFPPPAQFDGDAPPDAFRRPDLAWATPPAVDGGLTPGEADAADRDPADGSPGLDGGPRSERDAGIVRFDAGAVEDAGAADAAGPRAPRVTLEAEQDPLTGCGPRRVTLRWRTQDAEACHLLRSDVPDPTPLAPEAVRSGERVFDVHADTRFDLVCDNATGDAQASFVAVFDVALPDALRLNTRDEVRAAQRRCATPFGHAQVDNEGQVHNDDTTARRICRCEGYLQVAIEEADNSCFATPHDNRIGWWDGGQQAWRVDRAAPRNRCLDRLLCQQPVASCGELIYPR